MLDVTNLLKQQRGREREIIGTRQVPEPVRPCRVIMNCYLKTLSLGFLLLLLLLLIIGSCCWEAVHIAPHKGEPASRGVGFPRPCPPQSWRVVPP